MISIWTDKSGCEHLKLEDVPKYGRGGRGIPVNNILVRISDGYVFRAPDGLRGLEKLSDAEADMVRFYLDKLDGPIVPVVFAAGHAPDG